MKLQFSKHPSLLNNERGMYIMVFAAIMVAILFALGWAVDSSNLFLAQLRLQRATDFALDRTLLLGKERSKTPGVTPAGFTDAEIKAAVERLAADNLRMYIAQMGIKESFPANAPLPTDANGKTIPVNVAGIGTTTQTATGHLGIDPMVIDWVPGYSPDLNVRASGGAAMSVEGGEQAGKAFVVLLLDATGSMDGDSASHPGKSKWDDLVDAVVKFADAFKPDNQTRWLVIYKYADQRPFVKGPLWDYDDVWTDGTSEATLRTKMGPTICSQNVIHCNTCVSCGLATGYEKLKIVFDDPDPRNLYEAIRSDAVEKHIILLSDGRANTDRDIESKQLPDESAPKACPKEVNALKKLLESNGATAGDVQQAPKHVPYYYAAINMADLARAQGTTIHAVAFGNGSPITDNSYQEPNNGGTNEHPGSTVGFADYVLRRIANAKEPGPDFDLTCTNGNSYATLKSANRPNGFFASHEINDNFYENTFKKVLDAIFTGRRTS